MKGAKPSTLTVIRGGIVDVPAPPKNLPREAHGDWVQVTTDLADRKLLTESTLGVIEMYCWALYNVRECQKIILSEGIFVRTKTSVKPNPASSMLQRSQETVARLAVELGLTPSSRSRKGLQGPAAPEKEGIDDFI